ncbi:MAG: hypothetical protein CVT70_16390 [Alphaproteobacteria bacterium HGW-Alphaproteobacteria-1]|jgi:hypothetical protein|nr:MAG: hypothetical protein CVT70_16390 [Alphaproteobacteria bacterium HGW-Alphaproteobacteria-1]
MYEAFDSFLKVETWHTTHPMDDKRFNVALNQVVRNPDFDPEKMAEYFQSQFQVGPDDETHPFHEAIRRRQYQADAVRSFLHDIGEA